MKTGNIEVNNGMISSEQGSEPHTPESSKQIIYPTSSGWKVKNSAGLVTPVGKGAITGHSYAMTTQGISAGTHWVAGFYESEAAAAALTEASTTTTIGATNQNHGAHAFLVASGAGAASGGSGAVTIVVSGTSISENGTRTPADSEIIVTDITAITTNEYYETVKKWLGIVTYTLTVGATGHTAYNATLNYGLSKYDDFADRDFTVTDFEVEGLAGANDTGFDIILYKHSSTGWVYNVSAFVPGSSDIICQLSTDLSTDRELVSGKHAAYKRTELSIAVNGLDSEGVIIKVVTTANNSVEFANIRVGVLLS